MSAVYEVKHARYARQIRVAVDKDLPEEFEDLFRCFAFRIGYEELGPLVLIELSEEPSDVLSGKDVKRVFERIYKRFVRSSKKREVPLENQSITAPRDLTESQLDRTLGRFREELKSLGMIDLAIFDLCCIRGLPRKEVADALSISAAQISRRLHRIRETLSTFLMG